MHRKLMFMAVLMVVSFSASAAKVYWNVNIKGPIVSTVRAGFFIVPDSQTSPNPAGSAWDGSCGTTLYVGKKEDGSATPEWLQSEMIRLVNTAAVGNYQVRVAVYKVPGDDACYTGQVWPLIN